MKQTLTQALLATLVLALLYWFGLQAAPKVPALNHATEGKGSPA